MALVLVYVSDSDAQKLIGIEPVLQQFLFDRMESGKGGKEASDALHQIVVDIQNTFALSGYKRK